MECFGICSSKKNSEAVSEANAEQSEQREQPSAIDEIKTNAAEYAKSLLKYARYLQVSQQCIGKFNENDWVQGAYYLALALELQISVSSVQSEMLLCITRDIMDISNHLSEHDSKEVKNSLEETYSHPFRTYVELDQNSSDDTKIKQTFERMDTNSSRILLLNLKLQQLVSMVQKLELPTTTREIPQTSQSINQAVLEKWNSHLNELQKLRDAVNPLMKSPCRISKLHSHARKLVDYHEIMRKMAVDIANVPLDSEVLKSNIVRQLQVEYVNDFTLESGHGQAENIPGFDYIEHTGKSIKRIHDWLTGSILAARELVQNITKLINRTNSA